MAEMTAPPTVNLGRATRVPEGQGLCYVVGSDEIAVFRQRDGRLFATDNRCPHRRGPLAEGVLGGGRIICPLHGHQFNLDSGVGSEPAECLRVFAIKEVGGDLILNAGGHRQ